MTTALLMIHFRRQFREAEIVELIDKVVGLPGTVQSAIPGPRGLGIVRVGSTLWQATADQPLEPGTNVVVCDLCDGVLRVKVGSDL